MSMSDAYKLKAETNSDLLLGGVTIPERHQAKGDEHIRVFNKIAQGCSFFVSQGVYDVNAAKNFLSDYYYYGQAHDIPLVPILLTLTPCGSIKTLQFMKWLGISIPRWLENELIRSEDILHKSVDFSEQNWLELKSFADEKGIPIGCNIESVAIRKVEVEASIELLRRIGDN
jgi:5,10-methylenetetrahydrofolate reductase